MTSPAIKLARECGRPVGSFTHEVMNEFLETFYRRAQAQALRDAADHCHKEFGDYGDGATWYSTDYMRRLADKLEGQK